jgi:hypothetical protein
MMNVALRAAVTIMVVCEACIGIGSTIVLAQATRGMDALSQGARMRVEQS